MGARRGRRRDMGIAAVATGSNAGSKERQTNDGRRRERRRRREAWEQKITRRRRIASVRKDGGPAGSGRQQATNTLSATTMPPTILLTASGLVPHYAPSHRYPERRRAAQLARVALRLWPLQASHK